MSSAGATGAAAAAAAAAQAIKASGAIVKMKPDQFQLLLDKESVALVVTSERGMSKKLSYLMNYGGLFFYTTTKEPLRLPESAEIVIAEKIWIP